MQVSLVLKAELPAHSAAVYCLETEREGNFFFAGGGDKCITKWETASLQTPRLVARVESIVYCLSYFDEKKVLMAGDHSGYLYAFNLTENLMTHKFKLSEAPVFHIKRIPRYGYIAVSSGDGYLYILDDVDFKEISKLKLCESKVRQTDLNEEQSVLAACCGDGTLKLIDLATLTEKQSLQAHTNSAYAVRFAENEMFSGGWDGHFNKYTFSFRWEMKSSLAAHNYAIYDIALHPNLPVAVTASRDKSIKLWDSREFKIITKLTNDNGGGHLHSVNALKWLSPSLLISGGDDRKIRLWNFNYLAKHV